MAMAEYELAISLPFRRRHAINTTDRGREPVHVFVHVLVRVVNLLVQLQEVDTVIDVDICVGNVLALGPQGHGGNNEEQQ